MRKIKTPGLYKDLTWQEYAAIPAIRSTYLKKFLHCPANALVPQEETPALFFGSAADCFILDGEGEFNNRYVVTKKYNGDKRKAEWKDIKKSSEKLANATDRKVIDYDDYERIVGIYNNIQIHPTAKIYIGKREKCRTVFVWKDPELKVLCKCQLDVSVFRDVRAISDLKTTTDASEFGFRSQIERLHYDLSAAFYLQGASEVLNEKIDIFLLIAGEKEKPYRVEVHELSQDYIEQGSAKVRETIRKAVECQKTGVFEPFKNGGVIVQEPYSRKRE